MTRHRTIILIVGCLVAFVTAQSAALASSLLSGYGGPGQGNQAILGSALLNRPGGGSGSGGSGSGDSSSLASSSTTSPEAAASNGTGSSTRSGAGQKASGSHASGAHGGSQAHRSTTRSASPPIADVYAAAERNRPAPSTPSLGLSGADLLLVGLVLCMLALIGVLSRRLTRVPGAASSRGAGGG